MHHIHYFVQPQRREAIREALSLSLQVAFTLRGYVTQSGHARFDLLSQSTAWKEMLLPLGDSHIKLTGMLVVSPFWV